ncbi:hypothetical protein [Acidovorax sp. MR-S7]|uniref:hypothetical protein n=1 Tax=Acidovorax sp. MR-S7 TaxID=1268622 RepID=UPI00037E1B91|nr:hypothetical protein [Acidovorax sp. MR-S7]GAD20913.1 hypothetical protein AVS7_00674 [Acidovorax sp. MR-S7]
MYQLDAQSAREADSIGSYLTETGKYIGQFTRAEKLVSKNKGTHGIGFTFECAGQSTRFDIWTMDASNKHLGGFKAINAIMACMSLRGIAPAPGKVERYNWDTQQRETVQAEVFPELVGKPIGLVLQKTEYEKMRDGQYTGETGWRLEMLAPFRAADEFTAGEILDRKTKPEKLAAVMAMLTDRPLKKRAGPAPASAADRQATRPGAPGSGFDDMDDDIPF